MYDVHKIVCVAPQSFCGKSSWRRVMFACQAPSIAETFSRPRELAPVCEDYVGYPQGHLLSIGRTQGAAVRPLSEIEQILAARVEGSAEE